MFRVVYSPIMEPIWVQLVDSATVAVGQIVVGQANEGVSALAVASGANDTSQLQVPMGVVVGTNLYNPSYSSTYNGESITDSSPHTSTTEYVFGSEGIYPKGDKAAMVQIVPICPSTIIEGPIFNAALGTAPVVGTVTTGDTNGVSCTVNALEVAGVANLSTIYFRSGANRGVYRITDDTSTTALTWDKATPYDVAIGDTLVRINGLRPFGPSRAYIDSNSMYIDSSAALTANYFGVDVIKLDLSVSGKEHCYFRFNLDHFCLKRA